MVLVKLLQLILGLQSIDNGSVEINGFNVVKNFEKAIEKVGAIVENPDLYMYLSGYDNLKLVANLYKGIDSKRIDEVIKLVGLENRINDKVSKYSLGMRQRLGLAQAILHKPNLLILDEPTNGLDVITAKVVTDFLKELKSQNKIIIISTHIFSLVEKLCDRVGIIINGKMIKSGELVELTKEKDLEELFFELYKEEVGEK